MLRLIVVSSALFAFSRAAKPGTLSVTFDPALPALEDGWTYEGWCVNDDGPVTTGRFDDTAAAPDFSLDNVETCEKYVLTIEPKENDDPAPSAVHLLGGEFDFSDKTDISLALTYSHETALNGAIDTTAQNSFKLATPTNNNTTPNQGVWFLEMPGPVKSLNSLPDLPDGWRYEGWVANADGPVSTGRFQSAGAADDDGAGPAAGPLDAPPFPGQDFVDPARDLVAGEYAVIVSIEPEPDTSDAPFALKPLVSEQVMASAATANQNIAASVAGFPAGMAKIVVSDEVPTDDSPAATIVVSAAAVIAVAAAATLH